MRKFVVNADKLQLYYGDVLVAETNYSIEQPDSLFDGAYLSLFKFATKAQHRRKGFAGNLLKTICEYSKKALAIDAILLNVYTDNHAALMLYFNAGFCVYAYMDDDDAPYFTLIKRINHD